MKKQLIIYALLSIFVFLGCRKDDDPKIPELTRVPLPLITIDAASDKLINPSSPGTFKGKVTVDLYFKTDIAPKEMDIVVVKNGEKAAAKTVKTDVTTFPTTVDITGQQLIELFGPIEDGDEFEIGADITTQDGQLFQAFPTLGEGYGTGVNTQGGASTSVTFIKPCSFNADDYEGDFEVLQDEWNDYKVGTVIPVKKVSATQISFEYNKAFMDPGTSKPIILTIDPATNNITVAKQVYGYYTGDAEYAAESVAGAASVINPCDLSLSIRLKHTTTGFESSRTIRLKKK